VSFCPSVGVGLNDAESTIIGDGRVDAARRKFATPGQPGIAIVVSDPLDAFAKLSEDRAFAGGNQPLNVPLGNPNFLGEGL
jgi:hypothetical protein